MARRKVVKKSTAKKKPAKIEAPTFTVAIKEKKSKKIIKLFTFPFADALEAFSWGEKQAASFGSDYSFEILSKLSAAAAAAVAVEYAAANRK